MKKLLSSTIFLFIIISSFAQQFDWVKRLGNALDHQAFIVKTDAANNVYMAGYFGSGFYFVPETSSNLAQAFGGEDIFIAKYSSNGTFLWGKTIGGSGQDRPSGMDVAADGSISLTGYFNGTVDFNPGSSTNSLTSTGGRDIFVLKLDANGDYGWAHKFGSALADEGTAICFDPSGNVFVTGFFQETVDFNPGSATNNFTAISYDIFILKLDASGNYSWNYDLGSNPAEQGRAIQCDVSGNVYVSGSYGSTLDFNPGAGSEVMTASGVADIYLLKLTNSGEFIWSRKIGGISNEFGLSMSIDINGAAILGGYFANTTTFNSFPNVAITSAGLDDAFVVKFNSDGTHAWTRTIGSTGYDQTQAVATDVQGNVYATGFFQETVDLDPGAGVETYTAALEDCFVIKLSSNGDLVNASVMGGASSDYGYGIATDAIGGIYTCGSFTQTCDFDPSIALNQLTSIGGFDAFLTRWGQCVPLNGTDVQSACNEFTWIDGNTYTSNNNNATVQLTSVAGCDSTVTLNLTINTIDVSVAVNGLTLSANMSGVQYQWVNCNNNFQPISGAIQSSFTPTSSGNYAVVITANGCVETSACYFVNTVGADELGLESSFTVFPNPSNGSFWIRSNQFFKQTSIRVFNELGVLVVEQNLKGGELYDFNLNQPAGVYFIELTDENAHKAFHRIVIQE
ncbi:MAG: T9SS type A sorting domain-containing protein [Lacibacter sp.]